MTGHGQMDSARLRRDVSLLLRRRLVVYSAFGAAGLTAMLTLVAATTIPGKSAPAVTPPASQPDPVATAQPAVTQPGLGVPAQRPQSVFGGPPVAVSGGS